MPTFPILSPPPAVNEAYDRWINAFYLQATKRQTWTPTIDFATHGDLNVQYSFRSGWVKANPSGGASAWFVIATSTFTHTTSAGALAITGLPFTAVADSNFVGIGSLQWQGITNANYTQWFPYILGSSSTIMVSGCGSGHNNASLSASDMPTGGTVVLFGKLDFVL